MSERDGKKAVCPYCGNEWTENDRFCRCCGVKIDNPEHINNDFACIYGPAPVERTHRCEVCGYKWTTNLMVDNEAFCPKCGGKAPSSDQNSDKKAAKKRFFRKNCAQNAPFKRHKSCHRLKESR